MLRTHTCGELTKKNVGKKVTLTGWVHNRRDHGGIIFIDLRDRYGLTQIKFDPAVSKEALEQADKSRSEWVLKVTGEVLARPKDMINKNMGTGEVEVAISDIEILNTSKTPPFEISQEKQVNEEIRLEYRYLDLRHERLQELMKKRDELITYVREYFHKEDFIEIQTPILANESPEGARDYLVPSRLHPGKFYALPQAPQQFKQLLMVAGFDKYFQIAPCFRDEDPRADRHPGDFYQIDMEMSFVEQEDVWNAVEPLMVELTEKFSDKKLVEKKFPRFTYEEVMNRFGSDKPDLRFAMEIVPVSDVFAKSDFKVFAGALKDGGVIHALRVEGGAKFSRKDIDELTELAQQHHAKGLAYIVYEKELKSPILKFMSDDEIKAITKATGAKEGDIVFFGADKWETVCHSLGAVRNECGARLGLKDPKKAAWCWITDYPMYEQGDDGKWDFSHNPFSMPQGGLKALETDDLSTVKAYQYDLACNGYEISSGAIRNHDPKVMYAAFEKVGYSKDDVEKKFGHMIKAFSYGAPPHGGIAPGLDRILMVLGEHPSIRDIYAFPKNGQGQDAMLGAPSEVTDEQLKELHLKLNLEK